MKIQCACGAKYAFEVTPAQAQQPVQFVCPACGLDSSAYVTQLVREQFRLPVAPPPEVAPAPEIAAAPAVSPPPAPAPIQARIRSVEPRPAEEAPVADTRFCRKHPGVRPTEQCVVCGRPICPKCMEILGYVCSPLCRQKAELQGIEVPVFAGQKSVVEKRKWRKVGLVVGSVGGAAAVVLGLWIWYEFFASRPGVVFATRFEERASSGESVLCGTDQIVFLHGGTLARHDLKQKQQVWSAYLVDKQAIERQVQQTIKELQALQAKLDQEHPDADPIKIPPPDKMAKAAERAAAAMLSLRVVGSNVWVSSPEKLVRYDWSSGKPAKEISLKDHYGMPLARGEEYLLMDRQRGREVITHIDLRSGDSKEEIITLPESEIAAARATNAPPSKPTKSGPGTLAGNNGRSLDPRKVEDQVSRLPLPAQIALPATLAAQRNQERALTELEGPAGARSLAAAAAEESGEFFTLVPAPSGYLQFASRLLESRFVERQVMKAPPKKSALDGPVSVTATAEVANEILNEIQRDRGGDKVLEDESRYQVTLRHPEGKGAADWSAEVVGRPALHPLKTVNVITANKRIIVLDQKNVKLWESALTYNVPGGDLDGEASGGGQGPCVERGDMLFVFDQGVLSAFDLKTGNAKWRVPSVGISGMFFDEQGMMYVNSTTAGPESIKYSGQIDVTARTSGLILKLDPRTGKTLWSREVRGGICYLAGKFIYAMESHQAEEDEDGERPRMSIGLETDSFVRIRRINPANGKDMWRHFQLRCPLDAKFDHNTIHLVFKKEVQVLKYFSL